MFENTREGSVAGMKLELDCVGGSGDLVSKMLQPRQVVATKNPTIIRRAFTREFAP